MLFSLELYQEPGAGPIKSEETTYVRQRYGFSFFSLWKDVLGSSLPGSWSLPAPMMRFPKGINSFFYRVEMPPHTRRQASGRVLFSIRKGEHVRSLGTGGRRYRATGLGSAEWAGGLMVEGTGTWRVASLLEKLLWEMHWECGEAHERKEWIKVWGRVRKCVVRVCRRNSKALTEMSAAGWATSRKGAQGIRRGRYDNWSESYETYRVTPD